jgi:hypothetical protein
MPWIKESNSNSSFSQCRGRDNWDTFKLVNGEISKLGEDEITEMTGCLPSCKRSEFETRSVSVHISTRYSCVID